MEDDVKSPEREGEELTESELAEVTGGDFGILIRDEGGGILI